MNQKAWRERQRPSADEREQMRRARNYRRRSRLALMRRKVAPPSTTRRASASRRGSLGLGAQRRRAKRERARV